jgi:hypothetical protein
LGGGEGHGRRLRRRGGRGGVVRGRRRA